MGGSLSFLSLLDAGLPPLVLIVLSVPLFVFLGAFLG